MADSATSATRTGVVTTSDGVRLRYWEVGAGRPLVLIHGWSQSAEQFRYQMEALGDRYRIIAYDQRGHGESEKPDFGYKLGRLAKDLRDVLEALELRDVAALGHSMGCSVLWSYWDLFGPERLERLVFVDEPPFLTSNPVWSQEELEAAGPIFTPESAVETCNNLAGPEREATSRAIIGRMVTDAIDPDVKEWIIGRNLRMPDAHAAALLYNHCAQDWRDVIPRVTLPTMVVGGRVSRVPWKSQAWIHEQIPGSRLELFEEDEGGQHFMFIENPEKFNRLVADFVG